VIERRRLQNLGYKDLPRIGAYYQNGLRLEACNSDVSKLDPVAKGLKQSFASVGLSFEANAIEDADAKERHLSCGLLHVEVGSK